MAQRWESRGLANADPSGLGGDRPPGDAVLQAVGEKEGGMQRMNQATRIGWIALTVIMALLFLAWAREAKEKRAAGASRPGRGSIVTIKAGYPPLCLDSREGLDEALDLAGKDAEEVLRTILKYGGEVLRPGMKVKILDPGIMRTKVRALSSGRECWVVRELAE